MDRDDARFVADALAGRIAGDRDELDRLAASSLVRLFSLAKRIRELGGGWPPAAASALELEAICRHGGAICDAQASPSLQKFVDKMRQLEAEPPRAMPRNRAERRELASKISKDRRIIVPPALIH